MLSIPFGLYIHIPFCKKKCAYCDFVSYANKETLIDSYVEALVNEIKASPLLFPSPSKMERSGTSESSDGVRSIYFGGGTPTLLTPPHFEKILNVLITDYGSRVTDYEISVEANPGTADKAKLKALRQLGINRLSIGMQSFNDKHLKTHGRIHDGRTAIRFYEDARAAGFDNINLDLIFALPGQTLEEWKSDLQTAIDLKPEHISAYNLIIEEGTPLWHLTHPNLQITDYGLRVTDHGLRITSEDEEAAMYEHTIATLTAESYKQYEISNFSRPGYECHHNINYWKMGNWLGIGAAAHSHVDGKIWANPNCIEEYIMDAGRRQPDKTGTPADEKREAIFMGLRLLDGLPEEKFTGFENELNGLIAEGLLERSGGNIRLTRKGLMLGNLVFEKFI